MQVYIVPFFYYFLNETMVHTEKVKVSKGATIRNRYNQVPHLTQDTNYVKVKFPDDSLNNCQISNADQS